ncbi:MAG: hypothetical protein SO116_05130 [Treponema sp.]|nr:hypothetical protein [Treponema sp.]
MKIKFSFHKKQLFTIILIAAFPALLSAAKKKAEASQKVNVFASYPAAFGNIMNEALASATGGNFSGAIQCFTKKNGNKENLFDFLRNDFNSTASDSEKTLADKKIQELNIQLEKYLSLQNQLNEIKGDLTYALNISNYKNQLVQLAEIRNAVLRIGSEIGKINSSLYISYLSKGILGVRENSYSGIRGTMDCQFDFIINKLKSAVENEQAASVKTLAVTFNAQRLFQNISFEEGLASNLKLKDNAETLIRINALYSLLDSAENFQSDKEASYKNQTENFISLTKDFELLFNNLDASKKIEKSALTAPEKSSATLEEERNAYSEYLISSANNFSLFEKNAATARNSSALRNIASEKNKIPYVEEYISTFTTFCITLENSFRTKSIQFYIKAAGYYAECAEVIYGEMENKYSQLTIYVSPEKEISYPQRCLSQLEPFTKEVEYNKEVLNSFISKLDEGEIYSSNFIKERRIVEDYISRLSQLTQNNSLLESQAKARHLKAQLAKNEINLYYEKSVKNFNAKDYTQSFENLQKALSTYNSQIEILKNDGDIQEEVYNELINQRKAIVEKQKPILVSEIRDLKTQAKTQYYAGNFDNASILLSQADSKREVWSKLMDVSLQEDSELERLKDFVNTAIAIKEGRQISPYDSKAMEMTENLSIANIYFSKGKALLESGNSAQGNELLNKAIEKINLVKNFYPRNRDANLLKMKIEKLIDPVSFNLAFKEKFETLKETNFSLRDAVAWQAYTDLLDLQEMDSSYSGLNSVITNAQYSLGLKQKKTDEKEKQDSVKLYNEAKNLFASGKIQEAKEKATLAFQKDPDNGDAVELLDEIAFKNGEQSAVILSAKDEESYQKAYTYLRNNQPYAADEELRKILSTKGNERSAKVKKLQSQIEARKKQ